ncbi:SCO family protein [Methylobacterium symbioticum]|uniref:Thioredoxin domain-containing protein n=1 Tax=Methylobacterium symbioticum TaxID=2584084 RepID=A0A509EKI9_9HYPH|nr:SCO family protein [Methylobacterium symbioticum]VUD73999.1 hypothetical protein MET9862_04622 [Methylobacterium symbioticum]
MRHRRATGFGLVIGLALLSIGPAGARLSQADLARVAVAPPPDARAPLDLVFADAADGSRRTLAEAGAGRPLLLLPVDYTCRNVCDPMLALTAAALTATGLDPDRDYAFLLVGLDPRDGPESAQALLRAEPAGDARPRALVGEAGAVAALTGSLGYRFVPDPDTDSIAHPAAAILLTPEGRVARVLAPLALNGRDLRLALVEAGEGRSGGLADRLALLCYGFDAAKGIYTPLVRRILTGAAAATVLAIALLILVLGRRAGRA